MNRTDHQQAWQQDRLDLAEHFFMKLDTFSVQMDSEVVERLIDFLFEIGRHYLDIGSHEVAARWLGRASQLLEQQGLGRPGRDAKDIRLNVLHTYGKFSLAACHIVTNAGFPSTARSLLRLHDVEAGIKADEILELLQNVPNQQRQ